MHLSLKLGTIGLALAFSAVTAQAEGMLTGMNGMTLYTFDKDTDGVSVCYDDCATKWPPYIAGKDEKMPADWTMVARTDATMQWAYDGKPVYFFAGDAAKGDIAGDGLGGVWHMIKE